MAVEAASVEALRRQPHFLDHIYTCIIRDTATAEADADGEGNEEADSIRELLDLWEGHSDLAWQLTAEAHALTVVGIDAC